MGWKNAARTRDSARRPGRRAVRWTLLLAAGVVLSGAPACDRVAPAGFDDKRETMEKQVEVYAAAARDFHEEEGHWPEGLDDLFTRIRTPPRGNDVITRIERVEDSGDTALMPFLVERRTGPDGVRPELMGVVEVWPRSATDEPVAEIHWELADTRRERFGTVTVDSCAPREYAAQSSGSSSWKC